MLILASRFTSDATMLERFASSIAQLFDSRIEAIDVVVYAAAILGVTCGVLGSFVVLRRQSLLGDSIGHAVLPGVCLGFLFAGQRSTPAMLVGALGAGLLSAGMINLLERTTRLKSGECMGVVFTGMYGLGIVLLKAIQRSGLPGQAGLDKFLFGQIVGVANFDVLLMAIVSVIALGCVLLFWRPLAASSFDPSYSTSIGLPVGLTHYLFSALLTVAIVVSIQAVGVVLVAAMLVTPAVSAYQLTDRLPRMVMLAGVLGAAAGVLGALVSLLSTDLPTGALMVLAASSIFVLVYLAAPMNGLIPKAIRLMRRRRRTQGENLLRTLYLIHETRGNTDRRFGVHDVAAKRQETPQAVHRLWKIAARNGWADAGSADPIILTAAGFDEASRVVRNHRLWELFLTEEAKLASDHVHADAEYIEHILPPDIIRKLELMLAHPKSDPHGKPIPSVVGG